ncbi:hypothetical protein PAXINDRAFT_178293 [Paxillus involutus ATCC 200175]|nr:hypothetical protein PAXINDRAFT_178293 [Paxillus involutus ATCC 200175]
MRFLSVSLVLLALAWSRALTVQGAPAVDQESSLARRSGDYQGLEIRRDISLERRDTDVLTELVNLITGLLAGVSTALKAPSRPAVGLILDAADNFQPHDNEKRGIGSCRGPDHHRYHQQHVEQVLEHDASIFRSRDAETTPGIHTTPATPSNPATPATPGIPACTTSRCPKRQLDERSNVNDVSPDFYDEHS